MKDFHKAPPPPTSSASSSQLPGGVGTQPDEDPEQSIARRSSTSGHDALPPPLSRRTSTPTPLQRRSSTLSTLSARISPKTTFRNPAEIAHNDEARQLAEKQTTAARKLLYHPSDAVRSEISLAAKTLLNVIEGLPDADFKRLTKRLFSSGGLLRDKPHSEVTAILGRLLADMPPSEDSASGKDRAIFVSLLGDVGGLYGDKIKTRQILRSIVSGEVFEIRALRKNISNLLARENSTEPSSKIIKKVARSSAVAGRGGTLKWAERKQSSDASEHSGIFHLGEKVDEALGIPETERIPGVDYRDWHLIDARIDSTTEPQVGHVSGAPSEILMVWDILRGADADKIYTAIFDTTKGSGKKKGDTLNLMNALSDSEQEARYARAAGTGAMLIGLGHHSALEVLPDVLAYTGQDLACALGKNQRDAAEIFGEGAATDLISDLLGSQTKPKI